MVIQLIVSVRPRTDTFTKNPVLYGTGLGKQIILNLLRDRHFQLVGQLSLENGLVLQ